MHPKYVYAFEEGDGKNKQLLGGKGANLCEMRMSWPVSARPNQCLRRPASAVPMPPDTYEA